MPVQSDAWEGAEGPAQETGCGVLEGAPHLAEGKGAEVEGERKGKWGPQGASRVGELEHTSLQAAEDRGSGGRGWLGAGAQVTSSSKGVLLCF